jgi:hypothetical protein
VKNNIKIIKNLSIFDKILPSPSGVFKAMGANLEPHVIAMLWVGAVQRVH